jgi:hypothetical protein
MAGWAFVSLADLPPLGVRRRRGGDRTARRPQSVAIALYVIAAGLLGIYERRGAWSPWPSRSGSAPGRGARRRVAEPNWRLSWWEWHVLMLLAFVAIASALARSTPERIADRAFGGLYLQATLRRIDRWRQGHRRGAAADERGESTGPVLDHLRQEEPAATGGAPSSAGELRRLVRRSAYLRPR